MTLLYIRPQSITIPTSAGNAIGRIINHRHLGRFQLTASSVYGFLWVNPAVWSHTMLREPQSIWQISLLTDGAPSIQQSMCFILIPSNVYSRIPTQHASVPRLQWLLYSISVLLSYLHPTLHLFFPAWNDFLVIRANATLPCSESATGYVPHPQVGQPNRAIRQDIHHYPVGWSKWPWCSLHTQFQIPLGSIMRRFKQQERGWPSHLIPTIRDVISAWCCCEERKRVIRVFQGKRERRCRGESAGDESTAEN